MGIENEVYIGDRNTFAIRYVPGFSYKDSGHYYAYCHFVLGGQIIGDEDESCFLSTWKGTLEQLKDKFKHDFSSFSHPEFRNKNNEELFELIWKANQLEEDFKPEFSHLPILDNKVWAACHLSIDETTDAYRITMTNDNGAIKFLWSGWREPCPADKIDKLFSVTVDRGFIIATLEECLERIENEYLNYPKV